MRWRTAEGVARSARRARSGCGSRRSGRLLRWSAVLATLALGATMACGDSAAGATVDPATLPERTVARYRFVGANQELAKQLPCYCGCGQSLDHHSLRDCFVRDGGAYDAHAAGCAVCLAEARDAEQLHADGEAPVTIRAAIDERYGGLGQPTDTPPPTGF